MIGHSKEDAYVEQPTLEWLEELGWTIVHGPDIAPGQAAAERSGYGEVVLVGRLRAAIARINPELPAEAIERVIDEVRRIDFPTDPVRDHQAFHELLINGVPVTWTDDKSVERSMRAWLVDFRSPANNEFWAVNQFTIIQSQKNRRPDVLLFVNGLPLGQEELKNPADEAATPEAACNQVAHYRDTIPELYRYVEIAGVSDLLQARVGTISTPAEHFAQWKSMDPTEDEGRSQLEVQLRGVFEPGRLLDLIENFVLFQSDGAKTWKVMAKYHQVDAVNRAVEAAHAARGADGRAGVVWHTQGSGKSLTMAFFTLKIRRDPRFENPTIVALTDRNDLDEQLLGTFAGIPALAPAVRQAESIEDLRDKLNTPAGGIVHTTIQKFQAPEGEMLIISERSNVVVLADEIQRSQYGDLAQNMAAALPNAVKIGFSGTPIEKGDRSSRLTFGDYISIYSITRAVDDGATVPIFYESRRVPIEIGDEGEDLLETVEEVLEGEEEEAATKLVTGWSKLERVVGADARIKTVTDDIAEHFTERQEANEGKGLVVAMSRRICAAMTEALRDQFGEDAVECVMSASATDPLEISKFRKSKAELKQVADDFKDPDHPLKLVVVRDMWLTGFDVPALHTLYIDKPMRDHGLLQAIARVNRVFRDKPGGLVVDYIGIGDDLREALPAYAAEDVEEATVSLEEVVQKLTEKHEVVRDFFHGLGLEERTDKTAAEQATILANAVAKIVADEETTTRYLTEQGLFAKLYALAATDPAAVAIREDAAIYADIAAAVRKLSPKQGEASQAAKQAVKQFFSEGLSAGEVVDVLALTGEERPELSVLSDEFLDDLTERVPQRELQVALLRKLLNDEIRLRRSQNNLQAKLFSDELAALLERYADRQLSSAEIVQALVSLAKKMREARKRHEALGLSREEVAFYDALVGGDGDGDDGGGEWTADEKLADIAREVVKQLRDDLSVDWTDHEATEANIRRQVKRVLRQSDFKAVVNGGGGGGRVSIDYATDRIMEQARAIYRRWPDVPSGEVGL
jgi:type I restriction enzyme R subunit